MSPERAVLIVDDHRSFAEALAIALDLQHGLRCGAVAATGAEALSAAALIAPALAVVDLHLPDMPGTVLIGELRARHPDLAVLALTAYVDAASVVAASQAGAGAFLSKTSPVQQIIGALRTVTTTTMSLTPDVLALSWGPVDEPPVLREGRIHLTPREHEVLRLLGGAADVRCVARELGISIHTVRDHVKSLLAKFAVHTQLELVVRATQLGLIGDAAPTASVGSGPAPVRAAEPWPQTLGSGATTPGVRAVLA